MGDERGSERRAQELSADRIAQNDGIFRQTNERIREAAEAYEFPARIPFVCECANRECREILRLTLDEYSRIRSDPRRFVNAMGHEVSSEGSNEVVARGDGYVVVLKTGRAGDVVEQLEGGAGEAPKRIEQG